MKYAISFPSNSIGTLRINIYPGWAVVRAVTDWKEFSTKSDGFFSRNPECGADCVPDETAPTYVRKLMNIPGVESVAFDLSPKRTKIDLFGEFRYGHDGGFDWNLIIPKAIEILSQVEPDEPFEAIRWPARRAQAASVTDKRKQTLAAHILRGLKEVKEDNQVFLSTAENVTCGCVLAIAAVGSGQSPQFVELAINQGQSGTNFIAGLLRIPEPYAEMLDNLHRIDKVPARVIAQRLRRGEI